MRRGWYTTNMGTDLHLLMRVNVRYLKYACGLAAVPEIDSYHPVAPKSRRCKACQLPR